MGEVRRERGEVLLRMLSAWKLGMKEDIRRRTISMGEEYEKVMPGSCLSVTVICLPLVNLAK